MEFLDSKQYDMYSQAFLQFIVARQKAAKTQPTPI
jgi:hypothetical protein